MEARGWLARSVALVFVVSACGSTPAPTATASPSSEASRTPTAVAATPSPVAATTRPVASLTIDDLPRVELADVDATAVCDPVPSQTNIEAGESGIYCSDGLGLALRAVRTVTRDPVTRLYLHRPECAVVPCSDDELSTATVAIWTATDAFSIGLDSRLESVALAAAAQDADWPAPGNGHAPQTSRPSLDGAPDDLAGRDPYPFCGRAEIGDPPEVVGCFRDAVLAGRKAEMIERVYGTEGGEMLWIYRYDGSGRLVRYSHDQTISGDGGSADSWGRSEGAMILGITPLTWDFDPWFSTRL